LLAAAEPPAASSWEHDVFALHYIGVALHGRLCKMWARRQRERFAWQCCSGAAVVVGFDLHTLLLTCAAAGVGVFLQDNNGDNMLHVAARYNQVDVMKLLLTAAADAAAAGSPAVATARLGPAAAAVAKNKQSYSPLAAAACFGAGAVLPLLLEAHPEAAAIKDR